MLIKNGIHFIAFVLFSSSVLACCLSFSDNILYICCFLFSLLQTVRETDMPYLHIIYVRLLKNMFFSYRSRCLFPSIIIPLVFPLSPFLTPLSPSPTRSLLFGCLLFDFSARLLESNPAAQLRSCLLCLCPSSTLSVTHTHTRPQ